ncbi:MAG: DUF4827 domain-containing protein [Paludibacter sp.]|nr:DUF4827 domain-containing protein [Bacteroidales bacterium]MCM1068758.1 DUF4827 domain-containing protein [Prevotella sp.]MCM1354470.1 DUF4827 domain-containing protein [Bacteroides sp.]MCM1443273.1 DUF4827 domain-containing protein [Muribaculum sp.]MCM1481042.1 DUF4827 domain-containing protein [Paludibacter sp.]
MRTKTVLFCIGTFCLLTAFCSCNSNSYANSLKEEKQLIADYIKRNHINIIYEEPEDGRWGENDYLEIGDNCYFRLTNIGDTEGDTIAYKDKIQLRYRQYTLDVYPQIIKSIWTPNESANPIVFQNGVSSEETCTAWLLAVAHMKYNGAEGKLICPSKLGFSDASDSVIPYGYDLKIQIRKF